MLENQMNLNSRYSEVKIVASINIVQSIIDLTSFRTEAYVLDSIYMTILCISFEI